MKKKTKALLISQFFWPESFPINPIIKNYMQEKKIRIVLDKKNILLADENLDITKEIMVLLNKQIKTLKLN